MEGSEREEGIVVFSAGGRLSMVARITFRIARSGVHFLFVLMMVVGSF